MKRLLQGLRSKEAKGAIVSPINIFADQFLSIFSPIFKCFVKNMSYIIYSKLCLRISKFVTIISCFQMKYCYLELPNFFHYLVAVYQCPLFNIIIIIIITIIIIISFLKVDFYITFHSYKKPINVNLPRKLEKNSDTKRFANL